MSKSLKTVRRADDAPMVSHVAGKVYSEGAGIPELDELASILAARRGHNTHDVNAWVDAVAIARADILANRFQ